LASRRGHIVRVDRPQQRHIQIRPTPSQDLFHRGNHLWNRERLLGRDLLDRRRAALVRWFVSPTSGALIDHTGDAFKRLAVRDAAQYLIRPDGYIAYRCAGHELAGLFDYLRLFRPEI
jgi:hypothetical protein